MSIPGRELLQHTITLEELQLELQGIAHQTYSEEDCERIQWASLYERAYGCFREHFNRHRDDDARFEACRMVYLAAQVGMEKLGEALDLLEEFQYEKPYMITATLAKYRCRAKYGDGPGHDAVEKEAINEALSSERYILVVGNCG
jgi:hypothetical protein